MLTSPDAILSSDSSSMKLLDSGSGTITVPAGTNNTASAPIPHTYGDNNLIWEVVLTEIDGTATNNLTTPFVSSDGRVQALSTLTSSQLTITVTTTSATTAWPQTKWAYTYRILIP